MTAVAEKPVEKSAPTSAAPTQPQPTNPVPPAPAPLQPAVSTFMWSETVGKISAALAKAQAKIESAKKNAENPHFGHAYADLSAVWDACHPALNENEIAVVQLPWDTPQGIKLYTRFTHSSGEWVQCRLPVNPVKNDPQGIGSALTYMRRYALASMSGVAPEDDDGNAASGKQPPTQRDLDRQAARKEAAKPPENPAGSEKQAGKDEDLSGEWEATFVPAEVKSRTAIKDKGKKNEKRWTIFVVIDPDGASYDSFEKAHAELAKSAKEKGTSIKVTYTKKRYMDKVERNVKTIEIEGAQSTPEEPPAQ